MSLAVVVMGSKSEGELCRPVQKFGWLWHLMIRFKQVSRGLSLLERSLARFFLGGRNGPFGHKKTRSSLRGAGLEIGNARAYSPRPKRMKRFTEMVSPRSLLLASRRLLMVVSGSFTKPCSRRQRSE